MKYKMSERAKYLGSVTRTQSAYDTFFILCAKCRSVFINEAQCCI
jgi:hypothetical protein